MLLHLLLHSRTSPTAAASIASLPTLLPSATSRAAVGVRCVAFLSRRPRASQPPPTGPASSTLSPGSASFARPKQPISVLDRTKVWQDRVESKSRAQERSSRHMDDKVAQVPRTAKRATASATPYSQPQARSQARSLPASSSQQRTRAASLGDRKRELLSMSGSDDGRGTRRTTSSSLQPRYSQSKSAYEDEFRTSVRAARKEERQSSRAEAAAPPSSSSSSSSLLTRPNRFNDRKVVTNIVGAGKEKLEKLDKLRALKPKQRSNVVINLEEDIDEKDRRKKREKEMRRQAYAAKPEDLEQKMLGPPGKRKVILQAGPRFETTSFASERFHVKAPREAQSLLEADEEMAPKQDPDFGVDVNEYDKSLALAAKKKPVATRVPTPTEIDEIRKCIIYKDKSILVLNKPYGLRVMSENDTDLTVNSLLPYLQLDAAEPPRLVHRLDKETTGALLLARNARAATILTRAFKAMNIRKSYIAVTLGVPEYDCGFISCPLETLTSATAKRHEKSSGFVVLRKDLNFADREAFARTRGNALAAATTYTTLDRVSSSLAVVEFIPTTGRKHQIRVHAAEFLKTPLLGDYRYGPGVAPNVASMLGKLSWETESRDVKMHLHARSIIIPGAAKGKPLVIIAPLPPHFLETFNKLNFEERRINDFENQGLVQKPLRLTLTPDGGINAVDDTVKRKTKKMALKLKEKLGFKFLPKSVQENGTPSEIISAFSKPEPSRKRSERPEDGPSVKRRGADSRSDGSGPRKTSTRD